MDEFCYFSSDCPFEGKRCLECTFFCDVDAHVDTVLDYYDNSSCNIGDYDYYSYNMDESDYERGDREWDEL